MAPTLEQFRDCFGSFTCAKSNFSMTILGEPGAERLAGKGDMYFKSPQYNGLQRIQGVNIIPDELQQAIMSIKINSSRYCINENKFVITETDSEETEAGSNLLGSSGTTKRDVDDKLFARILMWSLGHESISCNMICDTFRIGWRRAKDFLNRLHSLEITGELYEKLLRAVLPTKLDDLSPETVDFLGLYGYTSTHIIEALNVKNSHTRRLDIPKRDSNEGKIASTDHTRQTSSRRARKLLKQLQNRRAGRNPAQ